MAAVRKMDTRKQQQQHTISDSCMAARGMPNGTQVSWKGRSAYREAKGDGDVDKGCRKKVAMAMASGNAWPAKMRHKNYAMVDQGTVKRFRVAMRRKWVDGW